MSDKKGIAEMSFEEFFSESKVDAERKENKKIDNKTTRQNTPKRERGFLGATPKINFNNGKFLLYVPRYSGLENDKFAVAVECGENIIPMDPLESVKQKGGRVTRPSTIDLTPASVTPMEDFIVTIDGVKAFENKAHPISFFNNIGSPMLRPMGEVTAVCKAGSKLKLFKAEIIDSTTKNNLEIFQLMVYTSGTAKIDDNPKSDTEEADEVPEAKDEPVETEEPKQKEVLEKPKKAPAKKVAVKGEIALSPASLDADVVFGRDRLPLYPGCPIATISTKGCEPGDCKLIVEGKDGVIATLSVVPRMIVDTRDYGGPITVRLEKGEKKLASVKYFMIPGFSCKYSGKGDITNDTVVEYNVFGESGTKDVKDDDPYTFQHGDMKFKVVWCVPYVTYDIGNGMVPFEATDVDFYDLKHMISVRVRGARKKALFFGGDTGKKREIVSDWDGENVDINLADLRNEIMASSNPLSIFITVNSFPNRKMVTIKNPLRISAKFQDGNIVSDIGTKNYCLCRFYMIDKSFTDVSLSEGINNVPVSPDVIEAEIIEEYEGEPCNVLPVKVRNIPFILKDAMGDKWMYVSRTKRIPLPEELFKDGVADLNAVKPWHERIVRMNPELKGITFEMISSAFKSFQ